LSNAAVVVGVVMGSSSDWETLRAATEILAEFGVAHEARVVSAHRMPDDMFAYAEGAAARGLKAIIAGAGGAAHLPGMLAAKTSVPVLGVPVPSKHLQGVDSLHSIVQMPKASRSRRSRSVRAAPPTRRCSRRDARQRDADLRAAARGLSGRARPMPRGR
jgi:phosphoribosylcarboxyaminoimidazole (NCAIR) mutase